MENENKYFTRHVAEGTVKRKHKCSFDPSIELSYLAGKGKKVIDSLLIMQAKATEKITSGNKDEGLKDGIKTAENDIRNKLENLRINGKPIIFEEFINSFDDEEMPEIIHFLNGGDMSLFGGQKGEPEKNVKSTSAM